MKTVETDAFTAALGLEESLLTSCDQQWTPVPALEDDEFRRLVQTHPVGQAVGAFWRRPWKLDFLWFLGPGPDPRPFSSEELARISYSIRTGGTVMVYASEQAALDIALSTIEAQSAVGNA